MFQRTFPSEDFPEFTKGLQEQCIDTSSTFQEILQRNRGASIYQYLTTEAYKVVNNICPTFMKTFFDFKENRYNITKFQEMRQQK